MNVFINPVTNIMHTHFTVCISAAHTHGLLGQVSRDALNLAHHKQLAKRISEVVGAANCTESAGVYDGIAERSYTVNCQDIAEVFELYNMGANYNQECILVVDHAADTVALLYMDGQTSLIGTALALAPCQTVKSDYTCIGGQRYVVL